MILNVRVRRTPRCWIFVELHTGHCSALSPTYGWVLIYGRTLVYTFSRRFTSWRLYFFIAALASALPARYSAHNLNPPVSILSPHPNKGPTCANRPLVNPIAEVVFRTSIDATGGGGSSPARTNSPINFCKSNLSPLNVTIASARDHKSWAIANIRTRSFGFTSSPRR